ncbi:MAG: TetR/AcrR family transcriptional regulator [Actinobacteria bacterium]|nr:TetR/AcrR family transcriptional regulator [Actinomycetota bacterium]
MGKTAVDDVARAARLSRATVYRHFPGGKDQLIRETVMWETARVVEDLRRTVAGATGLEDLLVETLIFGHRAVSTHEVLQKVLETEPQRILPALLSETPWLVQLLASHLQPAIESQPGRRAGMEPGEAAAHMARLVLSFITAPGGRDLDDAEVARGLVRAQFMPILVGD